MTKQQAGQIAQAIQMALVAAYAPYKQQGVRRRFRVRLAPVVESAFWEHFPDEYMNGYIRGVQIVLDCTLAYAPPDSPGWVIEQAAA